MHNDPSDLDALWESAPPADRLFDPADFTQLPPSAQRYLAHSIAPGTPLASAVRLRMHGAIRLSHWRPFKAEQVIVRDRGMIWQAHVRMRGVSIRGDDRFLDGAGAMRWNVFGHIPMIRASGRDITRSAAGRVAAESVWLPSLLCDDHVTWSDGEGAVAHAGVTIDGEVIDLALQLNQGCLQSVALSRWGNPDGGRFREVPFGGIVEQEATFGGYTIPARMSVGWYFGTDRFESEGRFFRLTIDDAVYR